MSVQVDRNDHDRVTRPPHPDRPASATPSTHPVEIFLCLGAVGSLVATAYAPTVASIIVGVALAIVATIWGKTGAAHSGRGLPLASACAGVVAAVLAVALGATNILPLGDLLHAGFRSSTGLYDPTGSGGLTNYTSIVPWSLGTSNEPRTTPGTDGMADSKTTSKQQLPPSTRLIPDGISASSAAPDSADSTGRGVTFGPQNTVDSDPTTAWRTPGNGYMQTVKLTWRNSVTVQSLGMIPGYAKVDTDGTDRFRQNRRVKVAEFIDSTGGTIARLSFADSPTMQTAPLNSPVVTTSVTMRIVQTTDPGDRDYVAVSEIYVGGQR